MEEREIIEKQLELESYIEALKGTVEDLKMGLNTISLMDNIEEANELARNLLSEFYLEDEFVKKTTLEKERDMSDS